MSTRSRRARARTTSRRILASTAAFAIAVGALVFGTATAAQAVAVAVSIQATNVTTQKSGSEFDYQVNLACSGTNSPTCNAAIIHIPLDATIGMDSWAYDVSGGPAGFIQEWHVDTTTHEIVVTLADSIPAGGSQSIILKLTPPNRTTPNGTTWSLLPSVSSTDPNMNATTAPAAATGTATATVPLTVSKSAPQTFYREGDQFDYTITATCPATPPVGSVDAADLVVTDTVPSGLIVVSVSPADGVVNGQTVTWTYSDASEVPTPCGGTAGTATPSTRTITVQVGPVGSGPGEIAPKTKLTNSVTASADPVGGGQKVTSTATRDIVVLGPTDDPFPGNTSVGKTASGPLNISASAQADMSGTYPGRWLPSGDNSTRPASVLDAAPASYTIGLRSDNNGFEYSIVDPVPCLDNRSGVSYSSLTSPAVCADPAFHVLGVVVTFGGAAPTSGYLPQYRDTSGALHDMVNQTANGWVIPTADLGKVAEIDIPRLAQQQDTSSAQVKVLGYADASTTRGDILSNTAAASWFIPATGAVAATGSHSAELHILDESQIGITKKMADIGGVTGTTSSLDLAATLIVPGAASHDLVISDLLPPGTTLATATSAVTGTLTWSGVPSPSKSTPALQVELTPDYSNGQELLRIVLPASEIPRESGTFTLTIKQLTVTKPSAPGVYSNTARVFYDDPDLSTRCTAGQYESLDPQGSRDDPATQQINCSADATFRTATSSSGQFALTKTVQGDYDSSPQEFPNVAHVKLDGGTAQYAINWTNTGAPSLQGVTLYDIFPHVGDTGVSGAQAGESRGSQFQPILASMDAAPAGVTISYSASANPCRPEVYPAQGPGCTNDWTADAASLGGLSKVLAVRVTSTAAYATGAGITIGFRQSVPTVSKDQIAWNSVAAFARTTSGTALLPAESPKVGITASDHRLSVGKTVATPSAGFGDTVTYTVTVGNVGTSTGDATTAQDRLPSGLTFVSADHGGSYDAASRTVTWPVPALARDTHLDLTVTATVDATQNATRITNSATVTDPAGYSPAIVTDPCSTDPAAACADLTVPLSPHGLALTGVQTVGVGLGIALLAIIAGGAALVWRRRVRRG
ncbi:hypothetical protein ACFPJ4_01595 [Lysinimonas soli]|uniref:DUF11 domain-containing protein n=1 Tax=Lysinimonas soli TaxID=1074233 RepID=A0ABW0NP10_9MICO